MYLPRHFEEARTDLLHAMMRRHPLATLVTLASGGLAANHLPLQLAPPTDDAPHGVLRGHVARANPLVRDASAGAEVLAIFHGPSAYVSPSWYATKKETGRNVPTWNYAVVHARGPLRMVDDPAWLRAHLTTLTHEHEATEPEPWSLDDAPAAYTEKLIQTIVGIEILVTELTGKWKVSQNQPARNRAGVARALRARGGDAAEAMADLILAAADAENTR